MDIIFVYFLNLTAVFDSILTVVATKLLSQKMLQEKLFLKLASKHSCFFGFFQLKPSLEQTSVKTSKLYACHFSLCVLYQEGFKLYRKQNLFLEKLPSSCALRGHFETSLKPIFLETLRRSLTKDHLPPKLFRLFLGSHLTVCYKAFKIRLQSSAVVLLTWYSLDVSSPHSPLPSKGIIKS